MRAKFIIRSPETSGDEPCVLGIIFNCADDDSGILTIGGPVRFMEAAELIVRNYFDVDGGLEAGDVIEEVRRFRANIEVEGDGIWETALASLEENFVVLPVRRFGRLMR